MSNFLDMLDNLSNRMMAAQSFIDGDFSTGAQLIANSIKAKQAAEQAKQQQEQAQKFAEALQKMGYSPEQITVAMQDPEAFTKAYADRYKPQKLGANESVYDISGNAPRPMVQTPDVITNKAGDRVQLNPDGTQKVTYTDTTPDIVPVQGQGVFPMDRHTGLAYPGTQSTPPAGAIEELKRNPGLAAHFDEAYGPGSSARYLGGGTGNGVGGFQSPPYRR